MASINEVMPNLPILFRPEKAKGRNRVILFDLGGQEPSKWTLTIENGTAKVGEGQTKTPKLTILDNSEHIVQMFTGEVPPMKLVNAKLLKMQGPMMDAIAFRDCGTSPRRGEMDTGIVSYGIALPKHRLAAEEVYRVWRNVAHDLLDKLSIGERGVTGPEEDTVNLAAAAGKMALERSGSAPERVGDLLHGTGTSPYATKSAATILVDALGLPAHLLVSDVQCAEKSGSTALLMAASLVEAGQMEYALVIAVPAGAVQVALRPRLAGSIDGVADYMRGYPYACLEQKVSIAVALQDAARQDRLTAELPAYRDGDGLLKYFPSSASGDPVLTAYVLSVTNEAGWRLPESVLGAAAAGLRLFVEVSLQRTPPMPTADLTLRKLAALAALARAGRAEPRLLGSIVVEPELWPTSAVIDWIDILVHLDGLPDRAARLAHAGQVLAFYAKSK